MDNHALRAMLSARAHLVAQSVTLANSIRGLLKVFGVVVKRAKGGWRQCSPAPRHTCPAKPPILLHQAHKLRSAPTTHRDRRSNEAANVLLRRSTRPCFLHSWGRALIERIGARKAVVAVARKLAVLLHGMWRDGSEFRFGDAVTAK
jgi:transposase